MQPKNTDPPTKAPRGLRVLFAASEALPLIKTGGLADVSGSLPPALKALGHDVRLVIPAYPKAVQNLARPGPAIELSIPEQAIEARLLGGFLPDTDVPVYLLDAPALFGREGNPYTDGSGQDWPDNATRFGYFCRVITAMALGHTALDWKPDVVHLNDWQTALAAPLIGAADRRPATLFTIHNLSYQGLFPPAQFHELGLPARLWSSAGVEFHGRFSFIKAGLSFADWLNTVSPTYAAEIQTPAYGCGLEGLLAHRSDRLAGVLNGLDAVAWNPATDPYIAQKYDVDSFDLKGANKRDIQKRFGLPERRDLPLFGYIGRLVEQKGVDLILQSLYALRRRHFQLIMLGTGDVRLEDALRQAAADFPNKVAVYIGHDEATAHRVEAGVDCFLMPSRFEPCGLNQMYSLRYGTVPIVRRTGGLADTVTDAHPEAVTTGRATGFVFDSANVEGLRWAMERALDMYSTGQTWWHSLAKTAMRQDFTWARSAQAYVGLYRAAIESPLPYPLA